MTTGSGFGTERERASQIGIRVLHHSSDLSSIRSIDDYHLSFRIRVILREIRDGGVELVIRIDRICQETTLLMCLGQYDN